MNDFDKLMNYAGVVGFLEGTLKFIQAWSDEKEVKSACEKALERAHQMLWGEQDVQN